MGRSARYAYFTGCSDGGREGLIEAERFPYDFNGIVAGAPAMNFQVQNSLFHGWQARSNTGRDGRAILNADRLPILHKAVLAACDGLDGQKDGLIAMPDRCRFDPMTIACRPRQPTTDCLTPAEATVARRFYAGPRDPRTGERLTVGGPQYGSELAWGGIYVPMAAGQPIFSTMIVSSSANLIFPNGKPATADAIVFDRATFDRLATRHPLNDATDPDLAPFAASGGKLILYHGWADQHISPLNTIAFHDAVHRTMGARAHTFERLYPMPGMYHCAGGEGPSRFDLLGAVMAWVEGGKAPDAIVTRTPAGSTDQAFGQPHTWSAAGSSRVGTDRGPPLAAAMPHAALVVPRSRPVYPYPYIARYTGRGDPNDAANYVRGDAAAVTVPAWAGSGFYKPYRGVTG